MITKDQLAEGARTLDLALIRQKCIAANPRPHEPWEYDGGSPVGSGYVKYGVCRLADVYLAVWPILEAMPETTAKENLKALGIVAGLLDIWDCRNDNLTKQSPECLYFLAELLK